MPYKVQFVGLVCFFRQNGSRIALLPDGRQDSPKHAGRIVVEAGQVVSHSGPWRRSEIASGDFELPACSLSLQGADQPGVLDTADHERLLPRLQVINPRFTIDPRTAKTVAAIDIRRGTLKAFGFPGAAIQQRVSVISELTVPHNRNITITVKPRRSGSPVRTLVLKAGTEIVVVNESVEQQGPVHHFGIYDRLSGSGETVGATPPSLSSRVLSKLTRSPSRHPFFSGPAQGNDECPNTGCCP